MQSNHRGTNTALAAISHLQCLCFRGGCTSGCCMWLAKCEQTASAVLLILWQSQATPRCTMIHEVQTLHRVAQQCIKVQTMHRLPYWVLHEAGKVRADCFCRSAHNLAVSGKIQMLSHPSSTNTALAAQQRSSQTLDWLLPYLSLPISSRIGKWQQIQSCAFTM